MINLSWAATHRAILEEPNFAMAMRQCLLGVNPKYKFTDAIKAIVTKKDPKTIPILIAVFHAKKHFHHKGTILHCFENAGFVARPEVVHFLEQVLRTEKNQNVQKVAWGILGKRMTKARRFRKFVGKVVRKMVPRKIRRMRRR